VNSTSANSIDNSIECADTEDLVTNQPQDTQKKQRSTYETNNIEEKVSEILFSVAIKNVRKPLSSKKLISKEIYFCKFCSKSFANRHSMGGHTSKAHPG